MIPAAIIGRSEMGGVKMRGVDIAVRAGLQFFDSRMLPPGRYGTLIIVKYWPDNIREIRSRCDRLILDPLDCWCQTQPQMKPQEFWRWCKEQTGCDAMVATAPSVAETMKSCGVEVLYAPHHADPRVGTDWYNPDGPVVYAGGGRYLGSEVKAIEAACARLGRDFVSRQDADCWQALQGAALALSCRFGPERTPLNIWCKPGVKLANAARAGIPVLATHDPAVFTLCDVEMVTGDWEADIAAALKSPPCNAPHAIDDYANLLRAIL